MKRIALSLLAALALMPAVAQDAPQGPFEQGLTEEVVLRTDDVVFRKIDAHTWYGTGHIMANETMYLLEGKKRAMLIDCGTVVRDLPQLVAKLTKKPVTLYATHVHPDHTGSAVNDFAEVWINPADTVNVPLYMKDYKGKVKFLKDHQVIDLGGRKVEVVFTPAHTHGSCTFVDKAAHVGFSGDSFGNGNLLLTTDFPTLSATSDKMAQYMKENGITQLWNGHYFGGNAETPQRVSDLGTISREALSHSLTAKPLPSTPFNQELGLTMLIDTLGVKVNHSLSSYLTAAERLDAEKQTADLLKQCGWFAIATIDGDRPQVRPFGATNIFENKLYLISGKRKNVAKQITQNPKVCITGVLPDGRWVRVNAQLVDDPRVTAKQSMLDANPGLNGSYSATDDNMIVWYLVDATVEIGGKEVLRF